MFEQEIRLQNMGKGELRRKILGFERGINVVR